MTSVLITVDTELSSGLHGAGLGVAENMQRSFYGAVGGKSFGVGWLMDQMDRRGIKGTFFVDPMPGMVHGQALVDEMVAAILSRGHEVQAHVHTEWLAWARDSPVAGRTGLNIGDFSLEDQIAVIGWANDALVKAGAPRPTAFRAGNFGANGDTLRALASLGYIWDSSFNADYAGGHCQIALGQIALGQIALARDTIGPVWCDDIWELPVAGIHDRPGHFRPAQVCALSAREMRQGLDHAAATKLHSFGVVTHSFEMLTRDRQRPNGLVMRRFESLCDSIARNPGLHGTIFADLAPPAAGAEPATGRLPASHTRTAARMVEQMLATWRYERRLRPV